MRGREQGTWSEADGTYELRGVVFDEVSLEFTKEGYAATQRSREEGSNRRSEAFAL